MPLFSSKKKVKIDLTEHHRDKRKMGKNVDPSRAITEEEPWAIAQQAGKGISQLRHKDQYGNEITDPDRSNPTRHRMERPLDTIRSFERAINHDYDRDYVPRRSNKYGSNPQYEQRASMAYQYGDQSARLSTHEHYDNGNSSSSQRPPYQQQRNSGHENVSNGARYRGDVPSDSNSGGSGGWSGDPYSTNPSSDASGYAIYEQQQRQQQQQYGQPGRLPLGSNDKPLPNINRLSGNSPPTGYQNDYSSQPQQQQNGYSQYNSYSQQQQPQNGYAQQQQQQYSSYNGQSQYEQNQGQFQQQNGQQQYSQATWNQQQPTKTAVSKSSAAAEGKEKRRSWFRRSKS